jgi:hypothetical protein
MAFRQSKKLPQFADLITVLARSKDTDNALYQTIQEIINRLDQFIASGVGIGTGDGTGPQGPQGPTGPPGPMPTLDQSFITVNDELSLPNERRLVAGSNITLDIVTPGEIKINSSGGGGTGGGMEYRGSYVPGTYNDGDVVVASDGIAYVCTVNGTTTPPEPWPGGGLATADGTYWTVTPHAGLANERALNSLANGYVKSTAGEPSTVPSIPPGDLPPFIAYTNIDNNFVAQRLGSGSGIVGANSILYFNHSTGPVNDKAWRFINYGVGDIRLEAMNDLNTVIMGSFQFGRAGNLSATSFAGNGANLTNLNASNLATGLVATPRLGSGTADTSTFLRGDQTWASPPGSVPTSAVLFMIVPCPPGYTRVAGWDGFYVRMGPTHVSGGASTHTHPVGSYAVPGHTHSAGGLTVDSHNHGNVTVGFGISGTTGGGGGHDHTFSGTTGGESNGQMNVDAGASGNMTKAPHTHPFSGTTSNEANHTHTFSGSGSGSGATGSASPGISGNTGTTGSAVAVTGTSGAANNNPLYIDFYACLKD